MFYPKQVATEKIPDSDMLQADKLSSELEKAKRELLDIIKDQKEKKETIKLLDKGNRLQEAEKERNKLHTLIKKQKEKEKAITLLDKMKNEEESEKKKRNLFLLVQKHKEKEDRIKLLGELSKDSEIARRIGEGEASNLTLEEKNTLVTSGFLFGIPLSPQTGTLLGAATSEERKKIIKKIYKAGEEGDALTRHDLLDNLRELTPSLPENILWNSTDLERRDFLSNIENLTLKLMSMGDNFSFKERKTILDEMSESVLLLQLKDFCPM